MNFTRLRGYLRISANYCWELAVKCMERSVLECSVRVNRQFQDESEKRLPGGLPRTHLSTEYEHTQTCFIWIMNLINYLMFLFEFVLKARGNERANK